MSVQNPDSSDWNIHPTPNENAPDTLTLHGPAGTVTLTEGDELVHREALDSDSLPPSKRLIEFQRYEIVGIARTANVLVEMGDGKRHISTPTWVVRLRCGGHAKAYCPVAIARNLSFSHSGWQSSPPTQMSSTFDSWRTWQSDLDAAKD